MTAKDIRYIVIHCSATRSNRPYTVEQLTRDHKARGFSSAGYHYYIRRDGTLHSLRPETQAGAHVKGYNNCSIGICYEGGLDPLGKPLDTRTDAQRRMILDLLHTLKQRYPNAVILGHRDLSPDVDGDGVVEPHEWLKLCPCFEVKSEYRNI